MTVFEMIAGGTAEATGERPQASYVTSPFGAAALSRPEAATEAATEALSYAPAGSSISTPFAEALASYDEAQLEAETFEALLAEFEDEDFVPALQALARLPAHPVARHAGPADSPAPGTPGGSPASGDCPENGVSGPITLSLAESPRRVRRLQPLRRVELWGYSESVPAGAAGACGADGG